VVREEHVQVDGARLWTATQGPDQGPEQGPALVLAHGGPALCDNLGPVADMVGDLLTVHRYDQRACGRSSGEGAGQTVASSIADLEALRRHWGHERWVVGGHSWGASLALLYALTHPHRVRAVVHLSGPGLTPAPARPRARSREERLSVADQARLAELRRTAGWGDHELDEELARLYWRTDFADASRAPDFRTTPLYDYPRNRVAAQALRASVAELARSQDLAAAARDLRVPVLVVHGRDDPVPIEPAAVLAELLPQGEFRPLPDVGHTPWLERPRLLRRALRSFLSDLP
jgi:proline iminopeptidase